MYVKDLMTPMPATCAPTTTLRLAAQLMADHDCSAIPVTWSGTLIGIITDRDITCRAVAVVSDAASRPVAEFMSAPVITVGSEETFERAAELMEENHIHHLPVIGSDGKLLGIVAESDLGRRMSNRELGRLARGVTIRRTGPAYSQVDALMRYPGKDV